MVIVELDQILHRLHRALVQAFQELGKLDNAVSTCKVIEHPVVLRAKTARFDSALHDSPSLFHRSDGRTDLLEALLCIIIIRSNCPWPRCPFCGIKETNTKALTVCLGTQGDWGHTCRDGRC